MLRPTPLMLILLLSTSVRAAAPFVIAPITIQVPAGFEGPFKKDFEGSTTVGVIIGTTLVVFHTQDIGIKPTTAMREAMSSIEAVKL